MRKKFLLYLPVALNNDSVVGGQVTAARGLYKFINDKELSHDVVDSVVPSGRLRLVKQFIVLVRALRLFFLSLIFSYRSSLFFYSTITGLVLRFIPALMVHLKGGHTAIFFRNSNLMTSSKLKLRVVRLLLRPYATLFVQGSRLESFFIQKGFCKEKVMIVPNWIPPDLSVKVKPVEPDQPQPLQLLFTGQVTKVKGVFELIEAVGNIEDRASVFLTIVGEGDAKEDCVNYCVAKGLSNVSIVPSVPHSVLMRNLGSYDVLVLPSHSEGFPNSVLEAMASGLAVIVTAVGEVQDSVVDNHNGFVVPVQSSRAIESSIRNYLHRRPLLIEHSKNAVITVRERHGWEMNCQRVCDRILR